MDYGTFHGIYTIVLMVVMFGVIFWAYSKRQKPSFDEAANSIFADDNKAKEVTKE